MGSYSKTIMMLQIHNTPGSRINSHDKKKKIIMPLPPFSPSQANSAVTQWVV